MPVIMNAGIGELTSTEVSCSSEYQNSMGLFGFHFPYTFEPLEMFIRIVRPECVFVTQIRRYRKTAD